MNLKKRICYLGIVLIFILSTLFSTGINVFASENAENIQNTNAEDIAAKLKDVDYAPDHVLVRIKDNANLDIKSAFQSKIDIKNVKKLTNSKGKQTKLAKSNKLNISLITLKEKGKQNVLDAIAVLNKNPNVEYAEPDYISKACTVPNDYYYANGSQANLNNIAMPDAWNITTGSSSVVVGVVDTGIDYNHPDLQSNMWHNPGEIASNGIDDDGNGYVDDVYGYDFVNNDNDPMDDNGHGTHCAGIIGANGNNAIGIAGMNWYVKLVALEAGDEDGYFNDSAVIAAINYAIEKGIPVLNNSYGGFSSSKSLYDAIANYNGLFIVAAGNWGQEYPIEYPSCYDLDNIISVAATDNNDQITYYSNYGINTADIAAPGDYIISTVPNSGYESMQGTSMAAPHVTGAAALILSIHPGYTAAQIKEAILKNCDLLPDLSGKCLTGGRLNVYKALLDSNAGFIFDAVTQTITRYEGNAVTLAIPSSIGGIAVKIIGRNAFAYNNELQSVSIPSSVRVVDDYAFFACDALTQINVDPNNPYLSSSDGVLFNKNGTILYQFPQSKGGYYTIPSGVINFNTYAFTGNNGLTSISFNATMTTVPNKLFAFCSALSYIDFQNITNIGSESFMNCSSLINLTLPDSLVSIGGDAFGHCVELSDLIINSNSLVIGPSSFEYSLSLDNIEINGCVSEIGVGSFLGSSSLEELTIPYNANIQTSIEFAAFCFCSSLNSVTLAKSVNFIDAAFWLGCAEDLVIYGCANSAAEAYANDDGISFQTIQNPIITVLTDITTLRNQHLDVYVSVDHGILVENCHTFYSNGSYTFYADDIVGNSSSLLVTVSNIIPKGDVNFDSKINSSDSVMVLQVVNGLITLTEEQTMAADVDSDGTITTTDATLIMQYAAHLITSFPNP